MPKVISVAVSCFAILGSFGAAHPSHALQADLVGTWKAEFVGPMGPRPQMVDDVMFTFRETPAGLTGTAKTEPEWPGELEVTDIKIDGNSFSFVGTGRLGWANNGVPHCCPRLTFAGSIKDDVMTLTLTWASTEKPDDSAADRLPMRAKRIR